MELLGSGLIGSLLGGIFRLAPEILKFLDRNNERKHELSMFKLQTDLEKQRGEFKVEERYVDFSVAQMQAIQAANETDAKIAQHSYKWVSALIGSVRPTVTYLMFLAYLVVKTTFIVNGFILGLPWMEIVSQTWTEQDFALLMMILTFWFIGRSVEKYQRS